MADLQGATANIGFERKNFHGINEISYFVSTIQVSFNLLLLQIQLQADHVVMKSFIAVAVYIFFMASVAEFKLQNSKIPCAIAGNLRIMAGATATGLPAFIPWPRMGWIIFTIWMSFFFWVAYFTYPEFCQWLYDAAFRTFHTLKGLLKSMKHHEVESDGTMKGHATGEEKELDEAP